MSTPKCAGCHQAASVELLQRPTKEPFPEPVYSCLPGAKLYGEGFYRAIPGIARRRRDDDLPAVHA